VNECGTAHHRTPNIVEGSTAFSLAAYFAMLRVSELAVKSSSGESGHALNYENVKLTKTNGENELHIKICSMWNGTSQNAKHC
jgi:hypothetical protein